MSKTLPKTTDMSEKIKRIVSSENPLEQLLDIMRYLRRHPEGCPWVKSQTHQSLVTHLLEESYETAETIDMGDVGASLRDELGDVLLQVAFHAEIADERGSFSFDDVAQAIVSKLVRRYPTVLGDEDHTLKSPEEIDRRWEEVKRAERAAKGLPADRVPSILDDISSALPALQRAQKLKGRAAREGWEWPDVSRLLEKINEEVGELQHELAQPQVDKDRAAAEFGDLLFMMVDLARWYGIDAEEALRTTNNRFERRFRHMESLLGKAYAHPFAAPAEARQAAWNDAKEKEKELFPV